MEIANDAGEEEQQPDQQQQEPEEAEEEEEHMGVGTAVEVEALHGVPGGRKSRPCKAKRDRYKKLVCKLMAEAGAEPGNFDFCRCQLPPSVAEDEVLKHKLRNRLEKDVRGLLAGAGADDGQSSMANSSWEPRPRSPGGPRTTTSSSAGQTSISCRSQEVAPDVQSGHGGACTAVLAEAFVTNVCFNRCLKNADNTREKGAKDLRIGYRANCTAAWLFAPQLLDNLQLALTGKVTRTRTAHCLHICNFCGDDFYVDLAPFKSVLTSGESCVLANLVRAESEAASELKLKNPGYSAVANMAVKVSEKKYEFTYSTGCLQPGKACTVPVKFYNLVPKSAAIGKKDVFLVRPDVDENGEDVKPVGKSNKGAKKERGGGGGDRFKAAVSLAKRGDGEQPRTEVAGVPKEWRHAKHLLH